MIYLTTGANGAGKTLNTLELVRKQQIEGGRSVYFNGFKLKPEKAQEFGWLPFDPTKWQDLPDGAILLCDECHNQFPVRPTGIKVPDYVQQIAEHRSRGFDFHLITQHPQNLDSFIRRLIGSPGWHRHLKRVFGSDMVSISEWSAVNPNCEKTGASKDARVSMVAFPKHVYSWYDSAVLHTGKKSIPKQVYILGALLLVIPVLFYYGFKMTGKKASAAVPASSPVVNGAGAGSAAAVHTLTPAEYVASYVPRLTGFPNTAPRYDAVTVPTEAPYPAACVSSAARCQCYTQQGTKLDTPPDVCKQIVKGGYFVDWGVKTMPSQLQKVQELPAGPVASAVNSEYVSPAANDGAVLASMRKKPV